ncbi:hypothetical protein PTTG_26751 [Puccinia triticina 1-1 BBBD Race 1]|uniref:RWD domain-containing protein n=1 Tax=Puccinia triticina (isolate 1-1 / race 1 (BBBD)) TaxID=630390 RepID=A0A180GTE1_PUCT1|nr:hypothetical protein PTTG_26751 [Puccinia triticina 1-1 BBBD Race 1]
MVSQEARQELALLEAMYPDRLAWIEGPTPDDQPILPRGSPSAQASPDRQTTFEIALALLFGDGQERPVDVRVTIGPTYPADAVPSVRLHRVADLAPSDTARFQAGFRAWLDGPAGLAPGEACVDVLLAKLGALAAAFVPTTSAPPPPLGTSPSRPVPVRSRRSPWPGPSSGCTTSRRPASARASPAGRASWASGAGPSPGKPPLLIPPQKAAPDNVRLCGSRYPGVLVIDGPRPAVEAYAGRLKALRWSAIQQRHFEAYELAPAAESEAQRRIHLGPHPNSPAEPDAPPLPILRTDAVVEVASMAQLVRLARAEGFDSLLCHILKIK